MSKINIGLKTPYNILGKKGGMEHLVNSIEQNLHDDGFNVDVFSFYKSVDDYSFVIIFNIFSFSNLLFVIKNITQKEKLIYFPLWHDPFMQGYYDKTLFSKFKTVLRYLFDILFVNLQSKIVKKFIVYSLFEAKKFMYNDVTLVSGPLSYSAHEDVNECLDNTKFYSGLFVGRLAKNKGINEYLTLVNKFPNKKFALVTGDNINYSHKNLDVYYSPDNRTKYSVFNKSKCLVVPSSYESFSLVVLEAICCGVIPVVSDRVMGNTYFSTLTDIYEFKLGDFDSLVNQFEIALNNDFESKNIHSDLHFYNSIKGLLS